MAASPVTVQGSIHGAPIAVNAAQANNSALTQISRRLANALGLTEFNDIYVAESISLFISRGSGGVPCLSWKISKFPIIIQSSLLPNAVMYSYPVINGQESDAFHEMIIGQDVNRFQPLGLELMMLSLQKSSRDIKITPGPGFDENVIFMGHNITYADIGLILRQDRNEFIEYPCLGSEAIDRIAVNHKNKQVVVRYKSGPTVYRYKEIKDDIIVAIHLRASSIGQIISTIRTNGNIYTSSNIFPDCHIYLKDDKDV